MAKEQTYQELKALALGEGMTLFGVADVREAKKEFLLPEATLKNLDYGVSIGFRLSNSILGTIEGAPNQSYYFHYQRINILLDQTALKITSWIQEKGYDAFPIPASQVIDWEKNRGSVSHREVARLAGQGWYGRNNLMVNPKCGSQARYATVLTSLPLHTDAPLQDSCGSCEACLSVCPAGAITREGYNLELCTKQLKEFIRTKKIGQMICGVCVQACKGTGSTK